ncbi:DUF1534 domain-containing protein, partial [Pseudomonas sp. PA-3-11C]|nr:DUF1534 domain-containing protein [Pseudomonas sp. PA-3-11C]
MRGNASCDALRYALKCGRGASRAAFPRGAWERSARSSLLVQLGHGANSRVIRPCQRLVCRLQKLEIPACQRLVQPLQRRVD